MPINKIHKIVKGMKDASLPSSYLAIFDIELPELEEGKLVVQRNGQSVWEHTMSVIDLLTVKNHTTLLSGLFHDLGKCCVSTVSDILFPRFPGHELESVRIARIRLKEWGANPYLIDRVIRIISTHMFDISNAMREKTIRKFVADVGIDNLENWFVMRVADSRCYSGQQKYRNNFIEPFKKEVMSYLSRQPSLGQPALGQSGNDGSMQIKGGDS